ncbi:prolyl 4-hydroxylase subunit alpha-1a [Engraulis encrasicolus]|uniref:prolyl 4-hydroxylase subunit alpha-1a n=1 Tax=Engraulis encrasicolus TaxID=184585 RepID=UPI002FD07D24
MDQRAVCVLLCISGLLHCAAAHTDVFTSIGQMTDLLFTEKDLVTSLKDYIIAEESKLQQIKQWAEKLDSLTLTATQDPEGFLGHPVNAFKLMKRLNTEWGDLENLVLKDMSTRFISNLTILRQYFPTEDDQAGAARALLRLQDTYKLDTNAISTGNLPGVELSNLPYQSTMTVEDCFELGKIAYSESDYLHTEQWMAQALRQLDQGEQSEVEAATVLDYLSYSVYQQGELEPALRYTKRLLQLDPGHQRANGNLKYFEFQLSKRRESEAEERERARDEGGVQEEVENRRKRQAENEVSEEYLPEKRKYEKLCRGEGLKMTTRRQSRLSCRYYDNNGHPRFLIGPVKQEDEWDRPHIVRFHDIISEQEIAKVKQLAKPRLRRATVHNPETGELTTAHYRVSKSAWLTEQDHPVVDRINQRIEDITGLEISTAEELQVANYGVGGQYEPHYDFGRKDEPDAFEELGTGNRIATWLFYMSDVAAGGATVFTEVGAAVRPLKGTAVFWYNLFPSGEGDYSTRHAACPVLVGNKWVSNKWIHERGQEFRRRCGLHELDRSHPLLPHPPPHLL